MTKLRELKFRYSDGVSGSTLQTNPNALTGATIPDEGLD